MKILLNGYTVNESLKLVRTESDIKLACLVITHIKKHKGLYFRLVVLTAFMIHVNLNFVFADDMALAIDTTFNTLIGMLKNLARYGCLGMGLKRLLEEMLSGASFKQASVAGMQYWLCYIFIQFYPMLFDMIRL